MNIEVVVTCNYKHNVPHQCKAEFSASSLEDGDTGIIKDVLQRVEIALEHHFHMEHPGLLPTTPALDECLDNLRQRRLAHDRAT